LEHPTNPTALYTITPNNTIIINFSKIDSDTTQLSAVRDPANQNTYSGFVSSIGGFYEINASLSVSGSPQELIILSLVSVDSLGLETAIQKTLFSASSNYAQVSVICHIGVGVQVRLKFTSLPVNSSGLTCPDHKTSVWCGNMTMNLIKQG